MDITITINTDNAAFEDDRGAEVARILTKLARYIRDNGPEYAHCRRLMDANGNAVGTVEAIGE